MRGAELGGGDCAGGAIGGAASAIAAPLIRDGLYAGSQTVFDNGDGTQTIRYGNIGYNATTVALATLIGGSAGALLGTNATAAALAAQNEALNNSLSVKIVPRPVPTPFGVVMMPMPVVTDDPIGTPNNGPQKSDPLTNPLEDQNSKGNAIATPNNGPQGSTLTGTPATNPRGPTILANPGCRSAAGLPCAAVTVIASVKDGVDKLSNVLSGGTGPASASSDISGSAPMINGVTVTDRATGNVYQGTVDLQPTLDRIASGVKYPSRNDGATFNNNEGLLPQQPAGYYTEYVVPTPNVKGVGPQRIVTGKNGEVFYTPDHYKTFTPVKR